PHAAAAARRAHAKPVAALGPLPERTAFLGLHPSSCPEEPAGAPRGAGHGRIEERGLPRRAGPFPRQGRTIDTGEKLADRAPRARVLRPTSRPPLPRSSRLESRGYGARSGTPACRA